MIITWKEAQEKKRSPLNIGRSTSRNRRKQQRSKENVAYRASLNQQKIRGGADNAAATQRMIDEIKNRK
jgi:hypothetical protein